MSIMNFWSDLTMWNKYGLAAIGAAALLALFAFVMF